jgi:hypothetical protein
MVVLVMSGGSAFDKEKKMCILYRMGSIDQ